MLDYQELFDLAPYQLSQKEKESVHQRWISSLGEFHRSNCSQYAALSSVLGNNPALPVQVFKDCELKSISQQDIVKTMTSSGTTGQRVSKIYLDRATSARQTKTLSRILADFMGAARLPMLIIDSSAVVKNRAMFSARGAGILGFSMFGRDVTYALDEDMHFDMDAVLAFQERHKGEKVFLFGFTFMVWQYFCQELLNRDIQLELKGVLVHGGGWKKLSDQAVENDEFKRVVRQTTGVEAVYNYYGMVEQTGSIFMECECGHLHASIFSDINIIDPLSMKKMPAGRGLIECVSLLPTSYPGHILLTEDEGEVLGVDDCPCGRKGKYFSVYGRMAGAEIRGCSDTHERK